MKRATHGKTVSMALLASAAALAMASRASADEGGVSFWAPGQFGSLAAVPGEPGFSLPVVWLHVSADAGAQKNFIVGGNLTAGIDAKADLLFFFPTFTFREPVWGAQAAFGLAYQQLSGDSGAGAALGAFKSRVFAIGPQVGYFFPVDKEKGYVNPKGYWEFAAENRAEGWNCG
jgi:hypothetical protein